MNLGMPADQLVLFAVYGVILAGMYGCLVWVILCQYRVLRHIHPKNRTLNPPMVWLNLIPCFNYVYGFITVNRVAESLDREFYDLRADERGDDYGRGLGNSGMGCVLATVLCGVFTAIPAVILGFLYAVKMREYTKRLVGLGGDEIAEAEDEPEAN